MSSQDVNTVTKQFESQLEHYTSEKRGARNSRIVSFLATAVTREAALAAPRELVACEFGGADGLLLSVLREKLGERLSPVNAELVESFAPRQAHAAIRFVPTSILESKFPDASFDIVIARHVLHHLVADTLAETRRNQARAFAELARVTRPGGLVLIEEHANPSRFSCRLLFHLSRLATRVGLRIPAFEVTPYTIVAFLTPREVVEIARTATGGALELLANECTPVPMPLQWRLTMLRRNSGNVFAAFRVAAPVARTS